MLKISLPSSYSRAASTPIQRGAAGRAKALSSKRIVHCLTFQPVISSPPRSFGAHTLINRSVSTRPYHNRASKLSMAGANASNSPADAHKPTEDQWDSKTYSAAAAFVPNLTAKILQLINPQPNDRVLDVGCGDGVFTAKYLPHVAEVLGVDASESFVRSANENYGAGSSAVQHMGQASAESGQNNARFRAKVVDCRFLEADEEVMRGGFDKAVSNAALHWILGSPTTRLSTVRAICTALKPGGRFVFEMGGAHNVAEVHTALISALAHHTSLSIAEAREFSPWFYPDEQEMRGLLEEVGFEVELLETEWRPTRLEKGKGGGVEGWMRLMGRQFIDKAEEEGRGKGEEVVREVREVLKSVVGRSDGSEWLAFVRLRGVGRKK